MSITLSGIGSGLDISGIVTQLVAAERAPAQNRLTVATNKQTRHHIGTRSAQCEPDEL